MQIDLNNAPVQPTPSSAGTDLPPEVQRPHPHRIGWVGTTALAMGGSNQSLFLITALFVGQGAISGQGSAAVPLLIVGLPWQLEPRLQVHRPCNPSRKIFDLHNKLMAIGYTNISLVKVVNNR